MSAVLSGGIWSRSDSKPHPLHRRDNTVVGIHLLLLTPCVPLVRPRVDDRLSLVLQQLATWSIRSRACLRDGLQPSAL
jgi:hypothetical protein